MRSPSGFLLDKSNRELSALLASNLVFCDRIPVGHPWHLRYPAVMPSSWGQSEIRDYPPEQEGSFLPQFVKWLDLHGLFIRIERREGKWFCMVTEELEDGMNIKFYGSEPCDTLNDALSQCYTAFRNDAGEIF